MGLACRSRFEARLKGLHILGEILEMMASEVRFCRSTLPECCGKLAERLPEPFREAFASVHEQTADESGRSFGELFVAEIGRCLQQLPFEKEEKEIFLQFANGLGFEETRMQIASIEQCRERLRALTDRLGRETAEKGRIATALGAMSGVLLVILLL